MKLNYETVTLQPQVWRGRLQPLPLPYGANTFLVYSPLKLYKWCALINHLVKRGFINSCSWRCCAAQPPGSSEPSCPWGRRNPRPRSAAAAAPEAAHGLPEHLILLPLPGLHRGSVRTQCCAPSSSSALVQPVWRAPAAPSSQLWAGSDQLLLLTAGTKNARGFTKK